MKKTTLFTRIVAMILVVMSFASIATMNVITTSAASKKSDIITSTFADLLEAGISAGVEAGVSDALSPLIGVIGKELFGLDPDADITEIKEHLDKIDSKLDDIKKEVTDGFDKVLSELDKNNKMKNAIDALAKAEFLAESIINDDQAYEFSDTDKLTPQQQKELVEINADIVNNQTITELYNNLKLAKEYMTTGYIDTNYENVFEVYYSYMKKQSMFCGEAANKSEPYWEVMKESYAKSCLALIYGLEHQKSIYLLSQSQPTAEISQEAIDAAAEASSFGTLSVINKRIADANKNAMTLLSKYDSFIDEVNAESTTFINKGQTYIKLNPQVGSVDISNCKNYKQYTSTNDFKQQGITEALYNRLLKEHSIYYFNNLNTKVYLNTISYDNFINNSGKCTYYVTHCDTYGSYETKHTDNWSTISDKLFTNIMLNMKVEQFNTANKLDNENISEIIKHVEKNYDTKTIAKYLESVGFNLDGLDTTAQNNLFLPTDDFSFGYRLERVDTKNDMYDVNSLNKKHDSFDDYIDRENPSGKLLFLEREEDSIALTIRSDSMNGRIKKGVYTIEGKLISSYDKNGEPVYTHYKKTYEVQGTKSRYIRLPSNIDFKTLKITLGYEGLGASSNHKNVCSYSLSKETKPCSEITLRMEGYTKIWLGYGVDASISCDDVVKATGKG